MSNDFVPMDGLKRLMEIKAGTELVMENDINREDGEEAEVELEITATLGTARMFAAVEPDGRTCVIAIQPNGTWWFVKRDRKKEPWES